jgi:hypothetical protein
MALPFSLYGMAALSELLKYIAFVTDGNRFSGA